MDETLEDLLARVALGDRKAFERLYGRTSAKLFGVCLRILRHRAGAEEAVQETYIRIWRNAGQYSRTRARPISWMCAIARNHAIDRLRTRKPHGASVDAALHVRDEAPSPEDRLAEHHEAARLHACLETLDPTHAGAIREAYFGGKTYRVLAEEHGVPLGTMKSWMRRSLIKLRDCLQR